MYFTFENEIRISNITKEVNVFQFCIRKKCCKMEKEKEKTN